MTYSYITKDNRDNRQHYMYSLYDGQEFLKDYKKIRKQALNEIENEIKGITNELMNHKDCQLNTFLVYIVNKLDYNNKNINEQIYEIEKISENAVSTTIKTNDLLKSIIRVTCKKSLNNDKKLDKKIYFLISGLTKSFEVLKRMYSSYDSSFKPINKTEYKFVKPYCLFAGVLGAYYLKTKNLKFLNCLLKINDTLISIHDDIIEKEDKVLTYLSIYIELKVIDDLIEKKIK